jgi:hypothetical protein
MSLLQQSGADFLKKSIIKNNGSALLPARLRPGGIKFRVPKIQGPRLRIKLNGAGRINL